MYLLFDIGGTKMRIAFSPEGKAFGKPKVVPTPPDFTRGMAVFQEAVRELSGGKKIKAAAGGIAGPIDKEKTRLVNSPHISGWIGEPLKKKLQNIVGAPVYLENDAAMAGLGEATYGRGKGKEIVVYITVSTGIGGARIVDGVIDKSAMGFEPGHQIIDADGTLCPECKSVPGYLERYASGSAIEARYWKKPDEIDEPSVWEEEARFLAYGLNNTIVHWSPNIVILGGAVMQRVSLERVRFHLRSVLKIFPEPPLIGEAVLGDFGGLYGALHLLSQIE